MKSIGDNIWYNIGHNISENIEKRFQLGVRHNIDFNAWCDMSNIISGNYAEFGVIRINILDRIHNDIRDTKQI